MNGIYLFAIALGLLFGVLGGFILSTMITVKRNIQDIHNAVCPEAAAAREESKNANRTQ